MPFRRTEALLRFDMRRIHSADGVELALYTSGPPSDELPTLVISAGLGGGLPAWQPLLTRLATRARFVAWDYRGLYRSGSAASNAYSIPHHAADLAAVIEESRARHPVLVGWSMGVQVNLELTRARPELPSAMIAIHGTYGRPLDTAFDSPLPGRISPYVFHFMRNHWRTAKGFASFLAASRPGRAAFIALCQHYGIMDGAVDRSVFERLARDWVELDLSAYADIFEHLNDHDAFDLLHAVRVPTLVIAGAKDRFSPAHLSQRMADAIPGAELLLIPGATHFGLLEYPGIIAERIARFLDERLSSHAQKGPAGWAGPPPDSERAP